MPYPLKSLSSNALLLAVCFFGLVFPLGAQSSFSPGFFPMKYSEADGSLHLQVQQEKIGSDFIYVNSLQAGIGSNDIGLDRGQLGDTRLVRFEEHGNKLLLIQPNLDYRATTSNAMEKRAMDEAFAQSVIWGFDIKESTDEAFIIDMTSFLMQDAHGISERLKRMGEGSYRVDASRSAIYAPMCKNFPKNTEFEALLTFTGTPSGRLLRTVVPSPDAITVRLHHSFVALPEDGYEPRVYDPRAGYFGTRWYDYATPIEEPTTQRFITRHRLEKKDPSSARSEAVEPIVYYLDPGTPEPVRSALLEGASWWNQAFEAAGFMNGFQVKMLPEDADPMDVRYNVIQWVHRSTRGWSYGASVVDPRTGEIIKGKVTLGSLRVRQDYLIANGLIGAYDSKEDRQRAIDMALARLRQLSAHEVGHTLGLSHNFAASVNDRASVMDYPHPLFLQKNGEIDLSSSYDTGIGEWDKIAIRYGYAITPSGQNEADFTRSILEEGIDAGLYYLTDQDARPAESPSSLAHLWDNGSNAVDELNRIMSLRKAVIQNFSTDRIPDFAPLSSMEEAYVPIFLMHRYQVEAAAKLLGGVDYTHEIKSPENAPDGAQTVGRGYQQDALDAVLSTLDASALSTPTKLMKLFGARAPQYGRDRESFQSNMGLVFDPISAAESAADHSLKFLLNPERLNRIDLQHRMGEGLNGGLNTLLSSSSDFLAKQMQSAKGQESLISMHVFSLYLDYLNHALYHKSAQMGTKEAIRTELNSLTQYEFGSNELTKKIESILEGKHKDHIPAAARIPDGSPIGMDLMCGHD